jgi:DNA-binding NarL/FixJ family response regulator
LPDWLDLWTVCHGGYYPRISLFSVLTNTERPELSCAGALRKAQAQPPDVLIMSARMPDISGIETGLCIRHTRLSMHSETGVQTVVRTRHRQG